MHASTVLRSLVFSAILVLSEVAPGFAESTASFALTPGLAVAEGHVTFANYKFRDGETLPNLRLHYVTIGRPHRNPNGAINNAVLLLHWTEASSQALLSVQFGRALFAPGAPLDAARFFIIIPDDIGHGESSKPSDGLKTRFPHYRYGDMVDLQHKLVVETLGIPHLHAIIGMSMGCMNAWQWAEAYPDTMDAIMPIACFPARISGRNLLWRRMAVQSFKFESENDSSRHGSGAPEIAPALIRMMIDGVPHLQTEVTSVQAADDFIARIGSQTARQDRNDAVYAFESSEDFDAEPELGRIKAKVFALNFADDEFYPDSLKILQRDMPKVAHGQYVVRPTSAGSAGHYSMAFPSLWRNQVAHFMEWSEAR